MLLSTLGLRQAENERNHAKINKLTADLKAKNKEFERLQADFKGLEDYIQSMPGEDPAELEEERARR